MRAAAAKGGRIASKLPIWLIAKNGSYLSSILHKEFGWLAKICSKVLKSRKALLTLRSKRIRITESLRRILLKRDSGRRSAIRSAVSCFLRFRAMRSRPSELHRTVLTVFRTLFQANSKRFRILRKIRWKLSTA